MYGFILYCLDVPIMYKALNLVLYPFSYRTFLNAAAMSIKQFDPWINAYL